MSKVITGMASSLDGIVSGDDGQQGRVYQWLFDDPKLSSREVLDELGVIEPIGAVVMGRNSFNDAPDADYTEYEFQVPIFVITHRPPATPPKGKMPFTFVTEGGVESAIRQAKKAAGNKDVVIVGGMQIIREAIRAGLVDEIHLDLVPVLLGKGDKLFGEIGVEPLELEVISAEQSFGVTHMKYRVKKG